MTRAGEPQEDAQVALFYTPLNWISCHTMGRTRDSAGCLSSTWSSWWPWLLGPTDCEEPSDSRGRARIYNPGVLRNTGLWHVNEQPTHFMENVFSLGYEIWRWNDSSLYMEIILRILSHKVLTILQLMNFIPNTTPSEFISFKTN